MGQSNPPKKPDDWILLGTLFHGVQLAMEKIGNAENLEYAQEVADTVSEFARDVGTISGIRCEATEGMTTITRDGRTAIVGTPDAFGTAKPRAPGEAPDDAASMFDNDEATEGMAFGGSMSDPLNLGRQLGTFLSKMMNIAPGLDNLGDRISWLNSIVTGMAGGMREEIPIPGIAAIYARTVTRILATYIMAAQLRGKNDLGLRGISTDDLTPDIKLTDFCTEKTPEEFRKVLEWLGQSQDITDAIGRLITTEDIQALGYGRTDPGTDPEPSRMRMRNGDTRH